MNEVQTRVNYSCWHLIPHGTANKIDKRGPKKWHRCEKKRNKVMVEVAHAGFFFFWSISLCKHSESKRTHIRRPGGWRRECTLTHGPAYANTHTGGRRATFVLWTGLHTRGCSHKWSHNRPACPPVQVEPCPCLQTLIQVCVLCFVSGYGLTDGKSSSFSIAHLILSPAYHLVCSTDVCGADVPPARFM